MPRRQWKLRIRHILDAIDKIRVYTAGMSLVRLSSPETQNSRLSTFNGGSR